MNTGKLIATISGIRDRKVLNQIIHAAEKRDSKLASEEYAKKVSAMWERYKHIKAGDLVFTHTPPLMKGFRKRRPDGKYDVRFIPIHGQYAELWGKPLTVKAVYPRNRSIIVRIAGNMKDYELPTYLLDRLKVSLEPTPEALANGLMNRSTT